MRWHRTAVVLICLCVLFAFGSDCNAKTNSIEFTEDEKNFIQEHPVVRLGIDPQFIPYEFFDNDSQYKGIAADYVNLISEKTGIIMEPEKDITWAEAYERVVEKKLDVLPCIAKTKEREPYFLFSEPYFSFQRVIVVNDSNTTIKKFEDLFNKKVAVKKNSSHHSYLKSFPSIEFSLYSTEEKALKALVDGVETCFVGNYANSNYQIKDNGLMHLKIIQINSENNQNLYFAVRSDWPELVGIINKGLKSITEEEKIEIQNRWIGIENAADYTKICRIIAIIGAIIAGVFIVSFYWIIKLKREIAARKKIQEAYKAAKEEAEIANRIKSTFLARMSHEIRTPLNAIIGMAYLMKKTDITTTQKIYLDKIILASRNMLGIINDILDFSKIEAGKIQIERVAFSLDKILQQVINIVSFKIEEYGIGFILNKEPSVPVNFMGDPTRLEQILTNVINNAVKFTESGEVSVNVRMVEEENDVVHVEFIIRDNGIGMSKEQVERLFQPFDQGDSSINRRFGGTGLGLSIVRSLVDMLGGDIQVDSTPGEGSTFTIRLPLEINREKEEEEKQKTASACFKNIRVLILEKNITYQNLLRNYLGSFNMKADFAVSGAEAAQLMRNAAHSGQKPYDLFIVDNDTPQEEGIYFINKVKEDHRIIFKPKFILMIPLMREDLFEEIEEKGIDFILTKPIIPSVLYNGIIEIFKEKVLEVHKDVSNSEGERNFTVDYPYHVLIVEDNKTNQFIAKSILEQAGFKVSLADNGETGYEFFKQHQDEIHLILMDLHMPILNGYESSSKIRKINTSVPIVAMTADAIMGVKEQCRRVGIDHYISKPFEPEQFAVTIWEILKPLEEERKKAKMEKTLLDEIPGINEVTLDEADGIRRIGNNKDLYFRVLAEYYRENKDVLSALTKSIGDRNYPDAVQIAHKIKSSSGNIGAKRLFAVASELQKALAKEEEAEISRLHKLFVDAYKQLFEELTQKVS